MYHQLTFYLDTCESGSMFDSELSSDISIYAVTSANPSESSWAQYCDSEAVVNGTNIGTCLADEFSILWMQDTENHDPKTRTLQEQYDFICKSMLFSHPLRYGDLSFVNEYLIDFFGQRNKSVFNKFLDTLNYYNPFRSLKGKFGKGKVRSHDMRLFYLKNKFENSNDPNDKINYYNELVAQERSKSIFKQFSNKFGLKRRFDHKKNKL